MTENSSPVENKILTVQLDALSRIYLVTYLFCYHKAVYSLLPLSYSSFNNYNNDDDDDDDDDIMIRSYLS